MLTRSRRAAAAICIVAAIALAGCGSSSSSTSSSAGSASSSSGATSPGLSPAAAMQRAQAAIAPFTGRHAAFPVRVPLKSPPKPGFTVAFMDCDSPTCALFHQLLIPAAKTMGIKLVDVSTGLTASSVNSAYQSVAQQKPNAIINGGEDPRLWLQALSTIKAAKIPVISTGIIDAGQYGLDTYPNNADSGPALFKLNGKLQADWVYAHLGTKAKIDYAWINGVSFSPIILSAFQAEMKQLCPGCSVQTTSVPVADLGTRAPQDVVSALQSHPGVNALVASASPVLLGLPSALKAAGINNLTTVGNGGVPVNFQYIKAGAQTVDLGADFPTSVWGLLDQAARAAEGQPFSPAQKAGIVVEQFLAQKDIVPSDLKQGWTGFPDFASMYARLWHP